MILPKVILETFYPIPQPNLRPPRDTIAAKINIYTVFKSLNLHITRRPFAEPIYMGRKLEGWAPSHRFSGPFMALQVLFAITAQ